MSRVYSVLFITNIPYINSFLMFYILILMFYILNLDNENVNLIIFEKHEVPFYTIKWTIFCSSFYYIVIHEHSFVKIS